jgi:hypothetical protein
MQQADTHGGDTLRVAVEHGGSVEALAARSRRALDAPLSAPGELVVTSVEAQDDVLVGAFDVAPAGGNVHRRISGGPRYGVRGRAVHALLALRTASALAKDADASKLLNRYVRPLLRALGKVAAPAHYFGRDWVSVAQRPAAAVAFAHDAASGRAVVEALVALDHAPWAFSSRASFLGKEPASLEEVAGRRLDVDKVAEAIASAYASAYPPSARVALDELGIGVREEAQAAPGATLDAPGALGALDALEGALAPETWGTTRSEAIGEVGAAWAGGRLVVGGELMVSRDAWADALARLGALGGEPSRAAVEQAIAGAFDREGAVLFGIESLASVVSVAASLVAEGRR